MKMFTAENLNMKTRAVMLTAIVLLVALAVNALVNISLATSKYREAMIAQTAALAEGVRKDINKAVGQGLPLNALEGMGDKLRELTEGDTNLSGVMIMDTEGKVLYASDRSLENSTRSDDASSKALAARSPVVLHYSDSTGVHYEKAMPLTGPDGKKIGVFRIALKDEAVNEQARSLIMSSVIVGLVSFVLAMALVYYYTDRRIKPLRELAKIASRMAAGDLSSAIAVKGQSELSELGNAINAMVSNLKATLTKIRLIDAGLAESLMLMGGAVRKMSQGARVQQEATDHTAAVVNEMVASIKGVAENAGEMSDAATNASSSASEMASSVEAVAGNTGALAAAVEDTASSIGQMIASIKQVSENMDAVATAAEQSSSSITQMSASVKEVEQRAVDSARLAEKVSQDASERGMVAAAEAIRGMRNIKEAVEETSAVVNRLGKRSQEIGRILKVIDEVTDQTGLLALNAAILAAKAGEHGRGFAVVAEEIKDLAERTASSTQEIAGLITSVREETAENVHAMGRGLKAVEAGVSLVNVTNEVLQQVADSSRQSAGMARAIEKTTAEQAKGVAQIMETSVGTARQIEQIANALQEQRKGSERIARAAERMREITRQVKTATAEQTTGSRQIANAVESVTMQAAQVARSTSEQNLGAQQISEAISRIQNITADTVDVSIEMDMTAQALKEKATALKTELDGFTF
jgi:methyl-accepting chemotaxis protein